jgi:hypothetical protein
MGSFKAHGGKEMSSKINTWKLRIYFFIGPLSSFPLLAPIKLYATIVDYIYIYPLWTIYRNPYLRNYIIY